MYSKFSSRKVKLPLETTHDFDAQMLKQNRQSKIKIVFPFPELSTNQASHFSGSEFWAVSGGGEAGGTSPEILTLSQYFSVAFPPEDSLQVPGMFSGLPQFYCKSQFSVLSTLPKGRTNTINAFGQELQCSISFRLSICTQAW